MARILKTGLRDLYDAAITKAWIQGYGEPEHEFEQIYNVENTEYEDVRGSYATPFGQWRQKSFGGELTYDSISQGFDVTITPYEYELGFTIERATVDDDRHNILGAQLATALAQSGRETVETLAASLFNSATSTTFASPWQSGGDAVALLATDHDIVTGGHYANTPSSTCDISIAALQASQIRLAKMQNSRGGKWPMKGTQVVVPSDSMYLVNEILGDTNLPYTANSTPNLLKRELTPLVWSRLTDTDCWFVLTPKAKIPGAKGHMLTCIWRKRPEFDRDNEWSTGDRRYKGYMRLGFGAWDFRGIDGSLGV
jgi:hypothetical protein